MTAAAADPSPRPTDAGAPRGRWAPVAGVALAAAGSTACLQAAGPVHGVLFGACGVAALLTPTLAAANGRVWPGAVLAAVGVTAGTVAGPLLAVLGGELTGHLFVGCVAVAGTLTLALAGLAAALTLARVTPTVAAAGVTLLALAWLGWPVWLSPWLAGNDGLVSWLSPAHPLLALDAAVVRSGGVPWAEHRLMYARLTVLGQHVFPRPPAGVGPAAAWHGAVGVVLLGIVAAADRVRRKRAGQRWLVCSSTPGP